MVPVCEQAQHRRVADHEHLAHAPQVDALAAGDLAERLAHGRARQAGERTRMIRITGRDEARHHIRAMGALRVRAHAQGERPRADEID